MIIILLVVLAVIVVIFVVVVALRPADFRVARSATIVASPAIVFAQVNDFHLWEAWSPWAKIDPDCKNVFEGPSTRSGAIFRWAGNRKIGQGCMTIRESQPNERIGIQLEFLRPITATNQVEFTFKPAGDQTGVTWTMSGKNNFMQKAFGLFVNCDKMIGGDFEKGLASLKSVAEAAAKN